MDVDDDESSCSDCGVCVVFGVAIKRGLVE